MQFSFHDHRLVELERELRPGDGPCPFVVVEPVDAAIRLTHFSAGRDATYVVVDMRLNATAHVNACDFTIGYAPFVEGTALIYDLTDETLQGKARPFHCKSGRSGRRVFAVLPVQIEATSIRRHGQHIEVEFRDARGERIEAALPFQMVVAGAGRERVDSYASTRRDGRFAQDVGDSIGASTWTATIRSLLTGGESSARLGP